MDPDNFVKFKIDSVYFALYKKEVSEQLKGNNEIKAKRE